MRTNLIYNMLFLSMNHAYTKFQNNLSLSYRLRKDVTGKNQKYEKKKRITGFHIHHYYIH